MESVPKDLRIEEDVEDVEEEEEEEEDMEDEEEDEAEEEEYEGDSVEVTVGRRSGRGLTLKTLLKERILEPGDGNMTINYLGNKFKGDLLSDGRIRSQESNKIFGTPSAWAIFCKKIVNPDKKSGCGWASVRYRGKKLDTYKNNWFRQKRLEYEKEEEEMEEEEESLSGSEEGAPAEQEIVEFEVLGNRGSNHDMSTMVELTTFQSIGRMQPFNITMSSSAMAVIDVHGHLTTSEVVGYLAGQWDVNNHNLIGSHALPVRCRLADTKNGGPTEKKLFDEMARLKLSLVGWYHTHTSAPPLPSLKDIDIQLDNEMKMKGYNDSSYTPVIGIIVSTYQKSPIHTKGLPHLNGNATGYWVMPPPENKPLEYGRPMSMQFTVVQDAFIPKEALMHMSDAIKYYTGCPDAVVWTDNFEDNIPYWHKLLRSLRGRVPKDHFPPLVDFLKKIIDIKLPDEDPVASTVPVTVPVTSAGETGRLDLVTSDEPRPSEIDSSMEEEHEASEIAIAARISYAELAASSSESYERKLKESTHSLAKSSNESTHVFDTDDGGFSKPDIPPPPKSYSPHFPLPPLFPIDSRRKETISPRSHSPAPLSLKSDDKKPFDLSQSNSAVHRDAKHLTTKEEAKVAESSKIAQPDTQTHSSYSSNSHASGSFLDLSFSPARSSDRPKGEESKEKEIQEQSFGLAAWFAQQKYTQDVYSLPSHERDHPFSRDPSLLRRELTSQAAADIPSRWNTGLNLGREPTPSNASSSSQEIPLYPAPPVSSSPFTFTLDSQPTYHQDYRYSNESKNSSADVSRSHERSTTVFNEEVELRESLPAPQHPAGNSQTSEPDQQPLDFS